MEIEQSSSDQKDNDGVSASCSDPGKSHEDEDEGQVEEHKPSYGQASEERRLVASKDSIKGQAIGQEAPADSE